MDELFDLPHVGTVVGGLVTQGIITEGVTMNVGPCEDGSFRPVTISSIKRNRAPCRLVRATQSAALAIDMPVASLRRGMCLVDPRNDEEQARPAYFFQVRLGFCQASLSEIQRVLKSIC